MLGLWIAGIVTVVVGYMIIKKYKPQPVLVAGAFILLSCSILMGMQPFVDTKTSTGFVWFDLFALLEKTLSSRVAQLGITIMTVGGFVRYMNHIGASRSLVYIAVKPLEKLHAPYTVLVGAYIIGQFLGLFINSASGLAMLLMVTMFPILSRIGVSRLSAAAIVGTTLCVDWSPGNVGPSLASGMSNLDVMTYWYTYQLPVAAITIVAVAVLHYFVQQYFDKKDAAKLEMLHMVEHPENEAVEERPPTFYWMLPMLPLTLLLVFSKLCLKSIKLDVIEAMLLSLMLAMLCEWIRRRDLKQVFADVQVFFDGMGKQFAVVVSLIVSGEMFAKGLQSVGAIDTIINAAHNAGFGTAAMMVVMVCIIGGSTVIMGSGNAAFLTFAHMIPDISLKMGVYPPLMLVPMEFASSIARSISPITAVIVVVCGIAKISPIELVKRTAIPMTGAFLVNIIATFLLFY